MIRRILGFLLIFAVLSLPASALAAEPAGGTISAQLVNGTANSSSGMADVEVKLITYQGDKETGSTTAKTQSDGQAVFNNLSTDSGYNYQLTFIYQEVEYSTDYVSFGDGETAKSVEVKVYDTTDSADTISIPAAHTVVYVGQGSLEVSQYDIFANDSDRAYAGFGEITATGKRKTLNFNFPDKATGFQPSYGLMECCVLPGEDGFIDTMPVLPEGREIVYGYTVKYSGDSYVFSQKLDYPVAQYNLLVQGDGVNIASDQMVDQGMVNMEGQQFRYYTGENLAADTTITATLSGLPKASNQKAVIIWIAVAMVLLTVGAGVVYRTRRGKPQVQPVRADVQGDQREHRLLLELARLDDEFAAGRIQEQAYRSQRAAKKAQLVKLLSGAKEVSRRK
ncbi:MAG: hypothetical protein HYX83_00930 [Chloroflexi bacterium]|nr:hypothetical protein [Chloroflexota bacterium]